MAEAGPQAARFHLSESRYSVSANQGVRMRASGVGRRTAMVGGAALATASLVGPREARAAKSLTVVLESEVTILDPHVITATITRTFGLHVFDMLFAMNEKGEIKPQMIESYDSSPDKLAWTFVLRDGLKWHDGQPVTAADCVASLRRWSVLSTEERR